MADQSPEIRAGARVKNFPSVGAATVVSVGWHGDTATVVYRDGNGALGEQMLVPEQLAKLEIAAADRPWGFDADAETFWLALESRRIQLASLFDPVLAVNSSLIEPLPHQILAVYDEMLPRQPLRFLLADDPGAGKTIMAGLLIKEFEVRGALERCLIICPGSLAEQWQDELFEKFHQRFDIATNDKIESSHTGNWFADNSRVIARLDKLSRNEDVQQMLEQCEWDLVIVDEAHKMSASYYGNEKKETKRYRLGRLVSRKTRHFLLMTATPHNGKEEDFQLFLGLLDGDRFEGKYREGVHVSDPSDLMRRLSKEELYRFDGTRLFPRREAHSLPYELSSDEQALYAAVTEYVREEFNRAEQLEDGNRRTSVGFALTVLQRRLASSPEAIYQSLRRRRERLESQARDAAAVLAGRQQELYRHYHLDDDFDEDELTGEELEELEEQVADRATTARSVQELQAELATLRRLEELAERVRNSPNYTKWNQLRDLLLEDEHMLNPDGSRRKLVIFTEHRDTLRDLVKRTSSLLGRPEAVITISGGMLRKDRRNAENAFRNDPTVEILIATDAAGEGINLQRAHLMVNYDLPWNPNRLEQRFGRIHRIGQDHTCHLWNLVAISTREGDVYHRLLGKLEKAREDLGGGVFDVIGPLVGSRNLREMLIDAIRRGDQPDTQREIEARLDDRLSIDRCRQLLSDQMLTPGAMDTTRIQEVRERMERAQLMRMQPRFIEQFFLRAFQHFGGQVVRRDRTFEVRHVPSRIRARDRQIGMRAPVLARYERITFEKSLVSSQVEFVCPGHPLLEALISLVHQDLGGLLRNGSVLIDRTDPGVEPWVLVTLEHTIRDADRDISRRLLFARVRPGGRVEPIGFAPHVDMRLPTAEERRALEPELDAGWLRAELEHAALGFAARELVPGHRHDVEPPRLELLEKTRREVQQRLTHEYNYWDRRAIELREQQRAGKQPKMNADEAERRADNLRTRLQDRLERIGRQKSLVLGSPVVTSGCFVAPIGLVDALLDRQPSSGNTASREEIDRIDRLAVARVLETERRLGRRPVEQAHNNPGYDVESKVLDADGNETGQLVWLEVKGKAAGRTEVTVSATQINMSFHEPDKWVLAIVPIDGDTAGEPVYVRRPFDDMASDQVASTNFKLDRLIARGGPPS